jgi:hypothetical protein
MAIYHLSVKAISRSAGRSATAAAAYRAGVEITDTRTGEVHDYTRKRGIMSADLVLPANAPEWAADRAALWNAAEHAERRKDACVAREFEVALPAELPAEARRQLALDFAKELADREGCAVDVAIHEPSKGGDNRNHHAHILRTTRKVEAEGLGAKLDTEKAGRNRAADLEAVRARWAELTNERLRQHGIDASVDHRSLKAQGIDREPTQHLGPTATAIERRTGAASRKRQDLDLQAADLLARAKQAGELERQGQALQQSIIDLSGDLAAAKMERIRQEAVEAGKRALEASKASMVDRYAQALKNVTSETLATVPGLLPVEAVRQALRQVGEAVEAKRSRAHSVDVDAVRRQVQAQPAMQQRLSQASRMEARAKATLEDVAGMGGLKRMIYDTKGMTDEAHQLLAAAKLERTQVSKDIEQSPEVQMALNSDEMARQARRRAVETFNELNEMLTRTDLGQAPYQRPEHIYRVPETVTHVVDQARAIAPGVLQGMLPAEIERMTGKAVDVEWKAPASQHEFEVRASRFVLPAEQRAQQLEKTKAKAQEKEQGPDLTW